LAENIDKARDDEKQQEEKNTVDKIKQRNLDAAHALWEDVNVKMKIAIAKNKEGLDFENATFHTRAQKSYKAAIALFRQMLAELDDIETLCKTHDYVAEKYLKNDAEGFNVEKTRVKTTKKLINTLLNSASLYLSDNLFAHSRRMCNEILKIDDDNKEAIKLKTEIMRRESAQRR
ncbi:hypothetical protein ACFL54_07235, partial [Planctomycetota bacterium]